MATRFDDWEGPFLQHHGVKGQKWGVRRYQNEDGSLTETGKKHLQKEFYKKLKDTGKKTMNQDFKSRIDASIKLLPKDRVKKLIAIGKRNEKELRRMTKGRITEDADYEKAFDGYYKEKARLVNDLLGKYGSRKIIGPEYRESASRVVDRIISRAENEIINKEKHERKRR